MRCDREPRPTKRHPRTPTVDSAGERAVDRDPVGGEQPGSRVHHPAAVPQGGVPFDALRDVGDDWLTFECRLRGTPRRPSRLHPIPGPVSLGRDLDHASFPAAAQGALDHPDGVPGLLRRDRHLAFPQDRGGHPGVEGLVGAGDAGQPAGQLQPGGLGGDGPVAVGGLGPPARVAGPAAGPQRLLLGSMPYLTKDPLSPWTSKCGTRARTKEPACRITRSWP